MKIRFVGGHLHGEVKDVQKEARYVEGYSYGHNKGSFDISLHTYERRRFYLSSIVGVEVMVYSKMQEHEALRALANIIDGV